MSRSLKFWCALLFLFAGAMTLLFASGRIGGRGTADPQSMTVMESDPAEDAEHHQVNDDALEQGIEPLEEFSFTDQKGKKFSSESLKGKIWVGSIFFATCPGTCRIQNTRVAELQGEYGDQGVEFVSITCDPDKDTPAALNDYSKLFGAQPEKWHFLTGDFELARKIGEKKFGITVLPQTHSDRLVLFNRKGKMVGRYRSLELDQFKILKTEIEKLLGGEVPAEGDAEADTGDEADAELQPSE